MQLTHRVSIHSAIPNKIFHNCKDSAAVPIPFICLALCKGILTPSVSSDSHALKLEENALLLMHHSHQASTSVSTVPSEIN